MINAEVTGYTLPVGLKRKWIDFQKSASRNWTPAGNSMNGIYIRNNDLTQSYRLYTLALAGSPDMGAMNRLREKGHKSTEVLWNLASAYILAGQTEAATQLVNNLSTNVQGYLEFSGTFGSALRDKAMILESLVLLDKRENAFKLLQEISEEINKADWLSTQSAAWCLCSAAKYAAKFYKGTESKFELLLNTEKTNLRTQIPVIKIPAKSINGKVTASFRNEGSNPLFVRILSRGIPLGIDSTSATKNLLMTVKYVDVSGAEIDPAKLKQGADFKMVINIRHPGQLSDYEEMVLTAVVPSGWEIMNRRLHDISLTNEASFDYQDIRDDRIYTYFDLGMNQQKTFIFSINAAYQGKFYQPPVRCEAMYDNSVYGQVPGRWVQIANR